MEKNKHDTIIWQPKCGLLHCPQFPYIWKSTFTFRNIRQCLCMFTWIPSQNVLILEFAYFLDPKELFLIGPGKKWETKEVFELIWLTDVAPVNHWYISIKLILELILGDYKILFICKLIVCWEMQLKKGDIERERERKERKKREKKRKKKGTKGKRNWSGVNKKSRALFFCFMQGTNSINLNQRWS